MTPKEKLLEAVRHGYCVDESGNVFLKDKEVGQWTNNDGYRYIYLKISGNKCIIFTHRLMAYQKFGMVIFDKKIHVRHLDGNRINNSFDNIAIGTASENRMDIPRHIRVAIGKKANSLRKISAPTIDFVMKLISDRKSGLTISEIMQKHSISKDRYYYVTRYSSLGAKVRESLQ